MIRLTFKNKKGTVQTVKLATERIVKNYIRDNYNVVEVITIIKE